MNPIEPGQPPFWPGNPGDWLSLQVAHGWHIYQIEFGAMYDVSYRVSLIFKYFSSPPPFHSLLILLIRHQKDVTLVTL